MKHRLLTTRQHALGVSISETHLYVTLPSSDSTGRLREWQLSPMGRADADWPALVEVLTELRTMRPSGYRALAVALLPPLVHLRRVELPKLRAADLRLVLARNAARYLPGVREPHTAGGVALTRSSPAQYLMTVAATRLVEAIVRAVQSSGWELATIVPAHATWAAAAQHRWPALGSHSGDVVVSLNDHIEIMQLQSGHLTGTRRLRREEHSAAPAAYTLDQPAYAAAVYAPDTSGPELLPERVYMQRTLVRRRTVTRLSVALAAASVLVAAGVLGHARYVLHQVVTQRAALQGRADQAAKAQGGIAVLTAPLGALGRIETNAVLWSQVVADLTEVLPPDASLASLRGHGDSLTVAGTAAHGATVFERIDGAKLIDDVRASAPIRREIKPGAAPVDRFEFVARIPGTVPLYSTKTPRGKHS